MRGWISKKANVYWTVISFMKYALCFFDDFTKWLKSEKEQKKKNEFYRTHFMRWPRRRDEMKNENDLSPPLLLINSTLNFDIIQNSYEIKLVATCVQHTLCIWFKIFWHTCTLSPLMNIHSTYTHSQALNQNAEYYIWESSTLFIAECHNLTLFIT